MGADLLIAGVAFPAHVAPDWEAARVFLDNLTRADMEDHQDWFLYEDDEELDDDGTSQSPEERFRSALHKDLREVEEVLTRDQDREVTWIHIGPYKLWLTGGMSWGDSPTEFFNPLNRVIEAGALDAAGAVGGGNRWADDAIQFPRLLSEIIATGLSEAQWDALLETMDLTSDELASLFDRAQDAWERAKERAR